MAKTFETYVPYSRRTFSDLDPQQNPELFSDADLRKEIAMLLRMNKKYGTHVLRVAAYLKLAQFIEDRKYAADAASLYADDPHAKDSEF